MTESRPVRFAIILPVESTPHGIWRGVELVRSVLAWEPALACCVVLDDAPAARGLTDMALFSRGCVAITITNPVRSRGGSWLGTLSAGILTALDWIHTHVEVDFVLRIDADALVIGPFARAVRDFGDACQDAGVIGSIGMSCNPETRARQDMRSEPRLLRARRLWPSAPAHAHDGGPDSGVDSGVDSVEDERIEVPSLGRVSVRQRRQFDRLRPDIDVAIANGYATYEYCQGGACVVTRRMIDRLASGGFFARAREWEGLPFPDDYVLAMYARAVDLRLYDLSAPGEPFGVQARGLAYPPAELAARGHAIIHSVKNDSRWSEVDIRDYYAHLTGHPDLQPR
jgi:hypothetical protein